MAKIKQIINSLSNNEAIVDAATIPQGKDRLLLFVIQTSGGFTRGVCANDEGAFSSVEEVLLKMGIDTVFTDNSIFWTQKNSALTINRMRPVFPAYTPIERELIDYIRAFN